MSGGLGRRIAFTLAALLVYRFGSYIPLPGTDIAAWAQITGYHSRDILFGVVDLPSAGTARHVAIFALGILPYITAAILIRAVSIGWPRLRALSAAGERGRGKIAAYTLILTIILTGFQAYGVAHALEGVRGLVPEPGQMFEFLTVISLTAGTMLLIWLSNLITACGIGNGLALILAVGLIVELPANVAVALEQARQGYISVNLVVAGAGLAAVITAFIVFVEGARREIAVDYPAQTIGGTVLESRSAPLMLKMNSAGLIPTVFVGWLIVILVLGFFAGGGAESAVVRQLGHGHPLFMVLFIVLVVLITLFYTAIVLDPEQAGKQIKTFGGVVRGVAPGEPTADYIDAVVSRVTLVGAVYLALVFIVPEILIVYFGVPFYLGGAAFLVVVCAVLDTAAQFKQEMQLKAGGIRR